MSDWITLHKDDDGYDTVVHHVGQETAETFAKEIALKGRECTTFRAESRCTPGYKYVCLR
jgi:hypothetical protein